MTLEELKNKFTIYVFFGRDIGEAEGEMIINAMKAASRLYGCRTVSGSEVEGHYRGIGIRADWSEGRH